MEILLDIQALNLLEYCHVMISGFMVRMYEDTPYMVRKHRFRPRFPCYCQNASVKGFVLTKHQCVHILSLYEGLH